MREGSASAPQVFNALRKREAEKFFACSKECCVWCGSGEAALELDHVRPKGVGKEERVHEDLMRVKYLQLAGQQPLSNDFFFEKRDQLFDLKGESEGYPSLAVSFENLVPACVPCNQPRRVRMFDGSVQSKGKHNRYPLFDDDTDAFFDPHKETWNSLLTTFSFVDLPYGSLLKAHRYVEPPSHSALTLILPDPVLLISDKKTNQRRALQAAVVIEVIGLNRRDLCRRRYERRLALAIQLELAEGQSIIEPKDGDNSALGYVRDNVNAARLALHIRKSVKTSPHRLAALSLIRDWLRDPLFNADQFMGGKVL